MPDHPDSKDPSTPSAAYVAMSPSWEKMQTLIDGRDAMVDKGETYLPKHTAEDADNYQERLNRARLINTTKRTWETLVGIPFSDPVVLDDVPEEIVALKDDIDLQGNDVTTFCRDWFGEGLAKAYSHVLVEMPRVVENEDGSARTLADDEAQNIRPYFVKVNPENMLFAHAEVVDGREILTQVRIRESITSLDGFAEVVTEQIRVITRDEITLWRMTKNKGKDGKPEWAEHESFPNRLGKITLVTFYTDRQAFMLGVPPLIDLADLNIAQWQSSSDQVNVMTVARFPMLAATGVAKEDQVTVGPRVMLQSTKADAKFFYVEPEGSSIKLGQEDIDTLKEEMASYGAKFLTRAPGNQTATARALDSAEEVSPLEDMVTRFKSAVNQALGFMADWMNLESGGSVSMTTDFGPEVFEAGDLATLDRARTARDISHETYIAELKKRGVLDEDLDFREERSRLQNEAGEGLEGNAETDLDPGQDDDPPTNDPE